ncbi:RNA polymerase sigma-70 factor, ECF subfamily [Dyadobacter koreensis]|uniref:RNA polymerase sigma-70 factor, ECF subfamily n=1 Tax=Dyadobacter koreensis TaxID=408657 RepID=A0A1H6SRL5_9BACT|nr:sigma-70 family RNA polymerase sigma factor [Dyadobacter koreensis]SEI70513.1 RNA polymerase sigma-70 factor, ECF subfamily [Dyadobacter koreensis]
MTTTYHYFSDEELTKLICQQNDELAFSELYRRHVRILVHTAIRKTGARTTAEDLVQEVFFKFWIGRNKFDIQKNAQAYLQGMLKYNIVNHYYQEQKKHLFSIDEVESPADDDTREHLDYNLLSELYEQSLLKLPEKCRQVFVLSRKGYTLKEIALTLEISEKTVEAHISKALRILRIEMKDYIALALISITFA